MKDMKVIFLVFFSTSLMIGCTKEQTGDNKPVIKNNQLKSIANPNTWYYSSAIAVRLRTYCPQGSGLTPQNVFCKSDGDNHELYARNTPYNNNDGDVLGLYTFSPNAPYVSPFGFALQPLNCKPYTGNYLQIASGPLSYIGAQSYLDPYNVRYYYFAKYDMGYSENGLQLIQLKQGDYEVNIKAYPNMLGDGVDNLLGPCPFGEAVLFEMMPVNRIALKAVVNGKFVREDLSINASNPPLIANSNVIDAGTIFYIIDLGNGQVTFKTSQDNKFVCADLSFGANGPLTANRNEVGAWEIYDKIDMGNNQVALRSHATNKFVCAENAGNSPLVANRATASFWETFEIMEVQ